MAKLRVIWLKVLLLLVTVSYSRAQDSCQIVDTVEKYCLAEGVVTVECPLHFIVVIKAVRIEIGSVNRCPAEEEERTCIVSDVTTEIKGECFFKRTCDLDLEIPTDRSACPSTEYVDDAFFIRLVYRCEALHNLGNAAKAMAICSDEEFTGSNVHIDSSSLVFEESEKISSTSCTCTVTVPPYTEVINSVLYLPPTDSNDQRIELVHGGTVHRIYSSEPRNLDLACRPQTTVWTVQFVNEDPRVELGFVVRFYTSHLSNITVQCGYGFVPTTTTSMSTTSTPTTPVPTTTPTTTTMSTSTTPTTTTSTTTPQSLATTTTTEATPSTSSSTSTKSTRASTAEDIDDITITTDQATQLEDNSTMSATNETGVAESKSKRLIWPIIVGILCAAILVLIICCIFVGLRYRRDKEREVIVEPSDSDRGSQFTYVTGVYVDGDSKSKLVVKKPVKDQMKSVIR